ncbi:uncharacterized protein LOC135487799 [Lineus longissimus]|uniref:uncharacterized protein LOC135487799 n=1 Tax=Lineus longissimus TaxID=88925 RepID=UPI002B4F20CD
MESRAMAEVSVQQDFARFKKTIESLAPVFQDILQHFENVAERHFKTGNREQKEEDMKSLLISENDEKYLQDTLRKSCAPVVAFVGSSNAGKSSLLNLVLGKTRIVPEKQHCCTARVVRLKRSTAPPGSRDGQSWCLLDKHGNRVSDPQAFQRRIPTELIDLEDEQRYGVDVEQVVEGTVFADGLLSYGVEVIDTPGLGESESLNNLLLKAMNNDIRPLIVYVINGQTFLKCEEFDLINNLKTSYPQAEFIFVVNKSDIDESHDSMDHSDGEDVVDGATNERDKRDCSVRRLGELETIMKKLKYLGYLNREEEFGKSEIFHCLSARLVRNARRKMKTKSGSELSDSEKLFLDSYERFHDCLVNRLHYIMRDLEVCVRDRVNNLLKSFLELLGSNRVGILKALHDMGDFIASAQKAENRIHENRSLHKIFDKIFSNEAVISSTLDTAKESLSRLAEGPVAMRKLEDIQRDPARRLWLKRFGLPEAGQEDGRPSREEEVNQRFIARIKAVSFAIEAELVIVNRVSSGLADRMEKALMESAGEFQDVMNEARSQNVEVLSGLFDQAYRVRHHKAGGFDGVAKMHDIVNCQWAPLKTMVWETVRRYCEEVLKTIKIKQANYKQWQTDFVEMAFSQLSEEEIGSRLREGCSNKLNEMHRDFIKITSRVKELREAVKRTGSENIKLLETDVKSRLLLHMCEVASIEFQRDQGRELEAGHRWLGQDGDFTIRECKANRDWVIYVARKCDFPDEQEWLKVTGHVFFASEMRKRLAKLHPNLVNCHGFWMPDRETFNVAFDRTDSTLAEYLNTRSPTLRERLSIALKIAHALADIHAVHLSHLDLRLSNIVMLGDEPKLLHCCSKSPLDPIVVEKDGKSTKHPPFHLHPDFTTRERTDATTYMDCYAYGMFLWILTTGSPEAYPEVFAAYDTIQRLSGARQERDTDILPEEPRASPGEEDLVTGLYELMKLTWRECKDLHMACVADHLEYLLDMRKESALFQAYPALKGATS